MPSAKSAPNASSAPTPTPSTALDSTSAPSAPIPGPRAARFTKVVNEALTHTLRTISYPNFAACFPTMAAEIPNQLQAMHAQMIERLGELATNEFASIFEMRRVVENLNRWEELCAEARRRRGRAGEGEGAVPPHALPASTIMAAHLAPQLAQQQSTLNAKLQTTQSQNATLFQEIVAQRAQMESLVNSLETVVRDLDGAVGSLSGEVDNLAQETRAVEAEMSGTGAS